MEVRLRPFVKVELKQLPDFNEMELVDRVELIEKTIGGDFVLAGSG